MLKKKDRITAKFLKVLLLSGAIVLAASSPYFFTNFLFSSFYKRSYRNNKERKKFYNTFYYLRRKGFLEIQTINKQIYVRLSEEGKKYAGDCQIDEMNIQKPASWDQKWRVIIFDVPHKHRIKREALRGKLKELGFAQLQKSVWVHPYECKAEIKILKDFFGLSDKDLQILLVEKIENDYKIRQKYKL